MLELKQIVRDCDLDVEIIRSQIPIEVVDLIFVAVMSVKNLHAYDIYSTLQGQFWIATTQYRMFLEHLSRTIDPNADLETRSYIFEKISKIDKSLRWKKDAGLSGIYYAQYKDGIETTKYYPFA